MSAKVQKNVARVVAALIALGTLAFIATHRVTTTREIWGTTEPTILALIIHSLMWTFGIVGGLCFVVWVFWLAFRKEEQ